MLTCDSVKKIYFAKPPWHEDGEYVRKLIRQTPNCSGTWKNIQITTTKDDADYIIVLDQTIEPVNMSKVIFFGREPKHVVPGYQDWQHDCFANYHHEKGNAWFGAVWLNLLSLETLSDINPVKTKNFSIIDTGKYRTEFHKYRVDLIKDFYSRHREFVDMFGPIVKRPLPKWEKEKALIDYRYNLAIENGRTPFYFSEKIFDPLLFLTMPIYLGCTEIHKYFPKNSFYEIDPSKSIQYINDELVELVNSNFREENIDSLKEARDLVLNKFNLVNEIYEAINFGKLL